MMNADVDRTARIQNRDPGADLRLNLPGML